MNNTDRFTDLVEHICTRRDMYVCGGSFYEVCAYISGYAEAATDCPLHGDDCKAFSEFVSATARFPSKYAWPYVLKLSSRDDEEAVARLRDLLVEFAERTKTESLDQIVQEAVSRAWNEKEGEPERVWRKFTRAFHRRDRFEIESLIQYHPEAAVLWSGNRPDDDVALSLDAIADSYLVSQISGSEEDGEVTIITPDFGPVNLRRSDDNWKIDISAIIDFCKAVRRMEAEE
jgi:2-oxo-4-hydroxy-4-carboxy--5-ureidoimidazoline (OHCU) decarboxylase